VDSSLYASGPHKQVTAIYPLNYTAQTLRRIIHYHEKCQGCLWARALPVAYV
jgi:hypothetical protein